MTSTDKPAAAALRSLTWRTQLAGLNGVQEIYFYQKFNENEELGVSSWVPASSRWRGQGCASGRVYLARLEAPRATDTVSVDVPLP